MKFHDKVTRGNNNLVILVRAYFAGGDPMARLFKIK